MSENRIQQLKRMGFDYLNQKSYKYEPSPVGNILGVDHMWYLNGSAITLHNEHGPAVVYNDGGSPKWFIQNVELTFDEWCDLTSKTDKERVILKLKYG
jgi:hypothetical protein